jgi:aminoglycoside phosphotransferase (APT) family kinase protein
MSRSLCDQLDQLNLPPAAQSALNLPPAGLRLRRAWPREPGRLQLEYLRPAGALLAGQWFADPARAGAIALQTLRAAERHGGSSYAYPLTTEPGGMLILQRAGADRKLPGLAPLLSRPGATLLVHRPERRAVVRLAAAGGPQYARILPPERLAAGLQNADTAAAALQGGPFAVPELLAADPVAGVARYAALPGQPLAALLDRPALPDLIQTIGAALRTLHIAPPAALHLHSAQAEIDVCTGWINHTTALAPRLGPYLHERLALVQAALKEPAEPLRLIHRDLYDKQLFVAAGGRLGLLDFDTLAVGEPALDLGNLIAHLELRALQGCLSLEQAQYAAAAFLKGYQPAAPTLRRLPAYLAAARLRLACVYSFRPRWAAVVPQLLQASLSSRNLEESILCNAS